ncbi:MAG: hypothetical protein Q8867_01705 [Bacteroidota bacterium]|nr:hypothetical protein [Bacteroidota bacterium]
MKISFFRSIIFIGILLWILNPTSLYSQKLTQFSGDSTKFIGELNTVFEGLQDKEYKMTVSVMQDFMQKWNQEQFNPSQKKIIYETCNQMLRKKMHPYPDFYNYIASLDLFITSHRQLSTFFEWSDVIKGLIQNKNSRLLSQFLDFSNEFFGDNYLYKSSSTAWKITNPAFRIIMDSVPIIQTGVTDLICYANQDSMTIYGTKGYFFPLSNRWAGEEGKVNWKRAGLDPDQVYAILHDYQIQVRFSKFSADSVEFVNRKYFKEPLTGSFTNKMLADMTEDRASYPRFASYDKQIGIRNLFPGIHYLGGFNMEGNKVVGTGTRDLNARLDFEKDNKVFATLRSQTFIIHGDRINSSLASITLYHEDDSIFHPGLQMKYINDRRELTLSRDEQVKTISPWFDSFHNIEIYCESLSWKMNDPTLQFEMMKGPNQEGKAIFESSDFFSASRYDRLQGIDDFNPLFLIANYCNKNKKREFTLDEITTFFQRPPEQVEMQILNLATKGFLIYDVANKKAVVKDKLFNYVKAKIGKTDYDVIFFNSAVSGKSNAVLKLDSFDLKIQGVEKVYLSDSQQVYIYPSHEEILLKKNRNFRFSGRVEAGLFDLYARDCSFDYDKFKLNMPVVDSMGVYVRSRTKDPKTQQYPMVHVKTMIRNINGELRIDDPKNKSGLKKFPDYPVFTNTSDAIVNWDNKSIQKGVYKKDKIYYDVAPFTFKNIDNIPTDSLQFKGYLVTGGIFPEIDESLKVRPDYSLGIEKETDTLGLPVYGGKGRFISHIDLSNQGLKGEGKLVYLNSTTSSKDFIFYPDSLKATAQNFTSDEVLAAVEYPSVNGDSLSEFWLPGQDSLTLKTLRKDAIMYNGQAAFKGKLAMTPQGVTGNGTIKTRDSEMDSRQFKFKRRTFDANIADFRIKAYNLTDLAISTQNYQTHFDFDAQKGEFKSNVGISKVEFPFNKYICSMDRFDWLIDNHKIALYNDKNRNLQNLDTISLDKLIDVQFPGTEFVSVDPLQDSLRFFSMQAIYDLKTNVINAEDVRILKVADAAIFPDSGKICIEKTGQMRPLKRAGILANTNTRYHHFYNATLSVYSRKKYSGDADYDYVDRTGRAQKIHFLKVAVDSSGQTFAETWISDSTRLNLSPEFVFMGKAWINAPEKFITLEGGFRPVTDCFKKLNTWTYFKSTIDPAHVMLPVTPNLRATNNEKLFAGLLMSNTHSRIYPAFFTGKESFSDSVMVSATGLASYAVQENEFRISEDSRNKTDEYSNVLKLEVNSCKLTGTGKINLGMIDGSLKMQTYGTLNYFLIPDSVNCRTAISMNFPFSDAALAKLVAQLQATNLNGLVFTTSPYYSAIQSIIGKKEFDKAKSELEMYGKFRKFPDELNRTLFLADVRMKWDTASGSWISYGPIGIGNIGKVQINRVVNGIIQIIKKRNGDDFTVYLELTKNDWYYFNYRNNLLQAMSSNLEFNDLIRTAVQSRAEQKRVDKISKGFRYVVATERKVRDFLRTFRENEE